MTELNKLVEEVRFRERFRGYDYDEVDAFVSAVSDAAARAQQTIEGLRQRIGAAEASMRTGVAPPKPTTPEQAVPPVGPSMEAPPMEAPAGSSMQAPSMQAQSMQAQSVQAQSMQAQSMQAPPMEAPPMEALADVAAVPPRESVRTEAQRLRDSLVRTLTRAEVTAEDITSQAKAEAAATVAAARDEARRLTRESRVEAEAKIAGAETQAAEIISAGNATARTQAEAIAARAQEGIEALHVRRDALKCEIWELEERMQGMRDEVETMFHKFRALTEELGATRSVEDVPGPLPAVDAANDAPGNDGESEWPEAITADVPADVYADIHADEDTAIADTELDDGDQQDDAADDSVDDHDTDPDADPVSGADDPTDHDLPDVASGNGDAATVPPQAPTHGTQAELANPGARRRRPRLRTAEEVRPNSTAANHTGQSERLEDTVEMEAVAPAASDHPEVTLGPPVFGDGQDNGDELVEQLRETLSNDAPLPFAHDPAADFFDQTEPAEDDFWANAGR